MNGRPIFQTRPLSTWPGARTRNPRRSPFDARWGQTLALLGRELRMLSARDVVVEVDVTEGDIRNDGQLYANARPRSPGVVLSFYAGKLGEPLRYPCDAFTDWQANVRAVALALEALRKVDRYGVTRHGEQYRGWKALPASTAAPITAEQAATLIAGYSGEDATNVLQSEAVRSKAIRRAQVATHPDRGGNAERFQAVQTAKQVLEAWAAR